MLKDLRKRTEGFTIIEVLIVLAIAGLILLIVFLAVPALQRNSRNTQRKNDVAAALGGVTEYANNHGGTLPSQWSDISGNVKVGFYTGSSDVSFGTDGTTDNTTSEKTVILVKGVKCDPTANGKGTTSGASSRNFVAYYTVENSSGAGTPICQES